MLGPLVSHATEQSSKNRARDLLARSAAIEQQQQVRNEVAAQAAATGATTPAAELPATPLNSTPSRLIPSRRKIQDGETRTYGLLTEIECRQQQIVLHVRAPGETLLLRAARFDAVDFISYRSTTPGTVSCGARRPAEDVYVTWRRGDASVPSGTSQGTAVAVELLPDGYVPSN